MSKLDAAVERARGLSVELKPYSYPIQRPTLPPGVVPAGAKAPVLAMDDHMSALFAFAANTFPGGGFPGFQYLAQLQTRAEYRAFGSVLGTEMTREWIKFTSKEDDDNNSNEKIKIIEEEFKRLNVRNIFKRCVEHDCAFGRAQIFINIRGADNKKPLIISPKSIGKGSLENLSTVEAVWTTPSMYNSGDPSAPDFYKPTNWFMLGKEVHASRLLTIITRPLPDMLKPAFNFSGMSLAQLAEPYVDNWLRTRQSVADLINNFSITALQTDMTQVLQGADDGSNLYKRAQLFTLMRSNRGLMVLDKEREDLKNISTPLGGLHELQAQAQEHMSTVSRIPTTILTGISPSGLNVSTDGEIRIFYDWVAAMFESDYRHPLEIILQVVQLNLFGEIDPNLGFEFNSLYQMTPAELATIRKSDADTATAYINAGVLDPMEERERLAHDPNSGYQGINVAAVPQMPEDDNFDNTDNLEETSKTDNKEKDKVK